MRSVDVKSGKLRYQNGTEPSCLFSDMNPCFRTYDKVEVKPAPGLNLLIGPNGTGKPIFLL